jgi:hypothetical protein
MPCPAREAIHALEDLGFTCRLAAPGERGPLWSLRWRKGSTSWECGAGDLGECGRLALHWLEARAIHDVERMAAYASPGTLG